MSILAMDEALGTAMKLIEHLLLAEARMQAPKDTGTFASGLESVFSEGMGDYQIEIIGTADVPLMEWVIAGTNPHTIGDGQFLYNPTEEFAAYGPVEHPGTVPNDFAERSLIAIAPVAADIIISAIREAFVV